MAGAARRYTLSRRATGRTLRILDEPTACLHFDDVKKPLGGLHPLVDQENTVLVIEHISRACAEAARPGAKVDLARGAQRPDIKA